MTAPVIDYEAGDDVTLHLVVVPDGGVPVDGTTTVTVTATHDSGTAVMPVVTPNDDRSQWSGVLRAVTAGEWDVLWTVTGTGSGVRSYRFMVAPVGASAFGRMYATAAQLADYLDEAPPSNARRLLRRASQMVDDALLTAIYRVDAAGMPVDAPVAAALAEACCAQVEWWGEIGDTAGSGAVATLAGARIGTVQLPGKAGTGDGIPDLAPAALAVLRRANLTGRGPIVYDRLSGGLLGQPEIPYYGAP